jgi:hypothetical protein
MSTYKTLGELAEPGYLFYWKGEKFIVMNESFMHRVCPKDITCVSSQGFFNFSADDKICEETGEMQE